MRNLESIVLQHWENVWVKYRPTRFILYNIENLVNKSPSAFKGKVGSAREVINGICGKLIDGPYVIEIPYMAYSEKEEGYIIEEFWGPRYGSGWFIYKSEDKADRHHWIS